MEVTFLRFENEELKKKIASLEAYTKKISELHEAIVKGHSDYIVELARRLDDTTAELIELQQERNPNPR